MEHTCWRLWKWPDQSRALHRAGRDSEVLRNWASAATDVQLRLSSSFCILDLWGPCFNMLTCMKPHTHTHTHIILHPCLIAYQLCSGCNCFPGKCCSAVFVVALLSCSISQLLTLITIQLVCGDEEEAGRSCTGYKNKKLFCRWGAGRWACVWAGFTNDRVC